MPLVVTDEIGPHAIGEVFLGSAAGGGGGTGRLRRKNENRFMGT